MAYADPVDFDPACDPDHPKVVSFEDISAASYRILGAVKKTPLIKSHLSSVYGLDFYMKCEFLQHTGSFKERGAVNTLLQLSEENKRRGVTAASLGNHSQGVSYHATRLNIKATVVMPVVAPMMKVEKCREYGGDVVLQGTNMAEAKHHAMLLNKEYGYVYINGYDHPDIIAGQGTCGLEIMEQLREADAVMVPVGGGSLLAGVSVAVKHIKPSCLIYGVETDMVPSMAHAMAVGRPTPVQISSTVADGLAVSMVGYNSFATAKPLIDKMVTVSEDWVARAVLKYIEAEKFVVEGAGAVGLAAIMAGLVPELKNKKVVSILSGGNIDTVILGRCLERGMAAEMRLLKFNVTISDRDGGLVSLIKLIHETGIHIRDMFQERAWVYGDIFSARIKVIGEARGPQHVQELKRTIAGKYKEYQFGQPICSSNCANVRSTETLQDS